MRRVYRFFRLFGFDARQFLSTTKGISRYNRNLRELKKQKGSDTTFRLGNRFPILNEWSEEAGVVSGHYFHQDLFVAQKVHENNPVRHIDIGSRIDGFVAHVASFRQIEILDIREIKTAVKNVKFTRADLMQLPENLVRSTDSMSCLHALEHFGLGRYGDPIDYTGHLKGFRNMTQILKPGGKFYFSTPIGEQRIEFNAHRVFSVAYLLDLFASDFTVDSFSYVDDKGDFHPDQPLVKENIAGNFGCTYGCGIFELSKKQ